jgi:hypothetical protein
MQCICIQKAQFIIKMFDVNTMCPLTTNMSMIVHPLADFHFILPFFASLPPWLQVYMIGMKLNTHLVLLLGIIINIVLSGININATLKQSHGVVFNVNYSNTAQTAEPPEEQEEAEEQFSELDKDILRVLAHETDAMPTRTLFVTLKEIYPHLQRETLQRSLQSLMRKRRIQSYTGNIASQKWCLIKEKGV